MTIKEAQEYLKTSLQNIYDDGEAKAITDIAIQHITHLDKAALHFDKNCLLDEKQQNCLLDYKKELLAHRPVQYVIGHTHFFGLDLIVNDSVLIPRPETEELVNWVIKFCDHKGLNNPTIVDIGTGSGCIALAIKKNIPNATITGMDISYEAIHVAKQNARMFQLDVEFLQDDILNPKKNWNGAFDIIISNPPYITQQEKIVMDNNVIMYEPHQALFVSDDDPLQFYKAIETQCYQLLKQTGTIFLELNQYYAIATKKLFEDNNWHTELKKDINDNYRMLYCYH